MSPRLLKCGTCLVFISSCFRSFGSNFFPMNILDKTVSVQCSKIKSSFPMNKSNHQKVFRKKGVLRNFTRFTGKHLYQSLFFNKVAGLRPATMLKKRLWHRCFPVNFVNFLRIPSSIEHLWWLLLHQLIYFWSVYLIRL